MKPITKQKDIDYSRPTMWGSEIRKLSFNGILRSTRLRIIYQGGDSEWFSQYSGATQAEPCWLEGYKGKKSHKKSIQLLKKYCKENKLDLKFYGQI